jgi:hypothetical protein
MPGLLLGRVAAVGAMAMILCSGCSRDAQPNPMSAVELQSGIAAQLSQAGTPPRWVECPHPLASHIGATTRCEVTFNDTDSVTALITAIKVDAGTTEWEITQAQLTKEQLVKRVAAMTGAKDVDCVSGIVGRVGNWVPCHVTINGVTVNQTAQIVDAKGLSLQVGVTQFMPLPQVEQQVEARLTALYGRRPDRTRCSGDLPGVPGSTIKCAATIGDNVDGWAVTVTGVSQGTIEFDVALPQRGAVGVPPGGAPS